MSTISTSMPAADMPGSLGFSAPVDTVADLVKRLGDVPISRIRMRPAPGTATVSDAVACERDQKCLCELVDGALVEKPMGYCEGMIAGAILEALRAYNRVAKLGKVTPGDSMMQISPNLVRLPDVGYAFWNRFPGGRLTSDPAPLLAPDVAVEVLSPSNTRREMERKRAEYFAAGTQMVWMVDLEQRTVTVYTSPERSVMLQSTDILEGGAVLPGFRMSLRDLFAELDEQAPPAPGI